MYRVNKHQPHHAMPGIRRSAPSLLLALWFTLIAFAPQAQVPGAAEWPNTDFSRTSVKLDEIMSGTLAHVIDPLVAEHNADLMAQLAES